MHLLNLQGDTQDIEAGARLLSAHLDFELSAHGMAVAVSRRPGALQVRLDGARASIACQTTAQFFRGLGLLLDALRAGRLCDLQETPHFSMVGAMFDASRNAVLTVSSIKRLLRSLALMGFNAFMLYTEDTYAVVQNPYGRLATVLSLKGDVGLRAKAACDAGQRDALRVLAEETLPALRDAFAALHAAHRELWMRTYKPFGWEVLDLRYGGARARVEAAIERLSAYLRREVDVIEELEQERLFFDERCNQYRRIVTTSYL